MSKVIKPPLNTQQIITHLLDDYNLIINNKIKATRYLETIGYYRFYGYMIPFFTDDNRNALIADTKFEDIINVYIFDRKLRILIIEALERIEISIRALIVDKLANMYNDGCFYANLNNFDRSKQGKLKDFIEHIHAKIKAYKNKELFNSSYLDDHLHPHPYAWLAFQNITFDSLVGFLQDICNDEQLKDVAAYFNMDDNVTHFKNCIRHLKDLRNVCAHHARCWNKDYPLIQEHEPLSRKLSRYIKFNSNVELYETDRTQLKRIVKFAKTKATQDLINKLISFVFLKKTLITYTEQYKVKQKNDNQDAHKSVIINKEQLDILQEFLDCAENLNGRTTRFITNLLKTTTLTYEQSTKNHIVELLMIEQFRYCSFLISSNEKILHDIKDLLLASYKEPKINKELPFYDNSKLIFDSNKRIYSRIEIIWCFIKIINPHSTWSQRIYDLMNEYNIMRTGGYLTHFKNVSQINMGFHSEWHLNSNFWNIKTTVRLSLINNKKKSKFDVSKIISKFRENLTKRFDKYF